jgi:hypothetical protein
VLASELGYRVAIRDLPDHGPGGWCDPKHKEIVIATGPANRSPPVTAPPATST